MVKGKKTTKTAGGAPRALSKNEERVRAVWPHAMGVLTPLVGQLMRGDRYRLVAFDEKGMTIERPATGSTVRVTRAMVERTAGRLLSGEVIPHREIVYTIANEYGVVLALGDLVEDDGKVYRLRKGAK